MQEVAVENHPKKGLIRERNAKATNSFQDQDTNMGNNKLPNFFIPKRKVEDDFIEKLDKINASFKANLLEQKLKAMMSNTSQNRNYQRLNKCTVLKFDDEFKLRKFLYQNGHGTDNLFEDRIASSLLGSQNTNSKFNQKRNRHRDKALEETYELYSEIDKFVGQNNSVNRKLTILKPKSSSFRVSSAEVQRVQIKKAKNHKRELSHLENTLQMSLIA